MKFTIKHEKKGRIRVHLFQKYMNFTQADTLQYYLENLDGVKKAQVFNRTSDALIYYTGERNELLKAIQAFGYSRVSVPAQVLENSGRELNETYKEKLVNKVIFHYGRKLLLPYPLSAIYTTAMSVKYIWLGVKTLWKRKIEVPVLDATAIGVSIFRGDFSTAGSVMFLLGIGELLEEWTHKKSVDDLARTMSLNTGKVWLRSEGTEVLVDADKIQAGDMVVVHMGNVVPFDGLIAEGEAMVNQASLTGESVPVRKVEGNSVYAGTVVEEGEAIRMLAVQKRKTTGRNSLKTKNQTSVKKGGHAENQRNKNFQSKNHRIPLLREWLLLKKSCTKNVYITFYKVSSI